MVLGRNEAGGENTSQVVVKESDWRGVLAIVFVIGFFALIGFFAFKGYSMTEIIAFIGATGTPLTLMVKWYFESKKNGNGNV